MADKKISQLPVGTLTSSTLFPVVAGGITSQVTYQDIQDGLTGSTSGGGNSYVRGWEIENENGNSVTLGKGLGKITLTNGSDAIIAVDGATFQGNDVGSPGYNNQFTVIIAGVRKYVGFNYVDDENGTIYGVFTDNRSDNEESTTWSYPTGDYDYYPYFITDANGEYSFAEGFQTTASGQFSHASGNNTQANGETSFVHGYNSSVNGNYSIVLGQNINGNVDNTTYVDRLNVKTLTRPSSGSSFTTVGVDSNGFIVTGTSSGSSSSYWSAGTGTNAIVTINSSNIASGYNSMASGRFTQATNNDSYAEGNQTISNGQTSHAEGLQTQALGDNSHAEGTQTTASGFGSHAEGNATIADGNNSHAEGTQTTASGFGSHAEGNLTIAGGRYSHAEGNSSRTTTSADSAHAEGENTLAQGKYSHSEGINTSAIGIGSHAQGSGTTTNGFYSFASGVDSQANGSISFVHGSGSTANGDYSIVLGRGITGVTNDTTFVDNLNIKQLLTLNVTSAPGSPVDGQVWLESNTNTGLKIRINGVTKTITLT